MTIQRPPITERDGEEIPLSELISKLNPNFDNGLTDSEAEKRSSRHGKNILSPKRRGSVWGVLSFLKEPMVWLLAVAGVIYLLLGDTLDAIVVLVAILPIGLIDVVIDVRKERALEQLEKMGEPRAFVVRNEVRVTVNPERLVPGDRLLVEEGQIVMADSAIVESSDLHVDESSLTGESVPVEKSKTESNSENIFGNVGSIFAGTRVLSGRATCLVVRTGSQTYYGKIGGSLASTTRVRTKLQKDIDWVVRTFGIAALALSLALIFLEILLGQSFSNAILGGVSLAIAAIPEELPVVFTLFLSLGILELARSDALVKKLPAVEALGNVNVICTDKTGTLTTGRMAVKEVFANELHYSIEAFLRAEESKVFFLYAMMACEERPFDYMEKAIYEVGEKCGAPSEIKSWKLVREYAFDPKEKYMSHVWESLESGKIVISAKGAMEAILPRCLLSGERRSLILAANEKMGESGVRVLALAYRYLDNLSKSREESEREMTSAGLIGFLDPLREGIPSSVQEAQSAGIRVIMLTGDHKTTAHAIAHAAGLEHNIVISGDEIDAMDESRFGEALRECNVFCRVLPEQKLRIVETLQKTGNSVAVTGDGINDSPALKRADIGIAMGLRGTDVAKEASSLVLLDDNFNTIVKAVRNGRKIYDNIQSAFRYLVAFHLPIFLSALIIPILGLPLLLVPVDIVVLELVLHPVVSIVFERQKAEPGIMKRKPRTKTDKILDGRQFARLAAIGFLIFILSTLLYFWGVSRGLDERSARGLGLTMMIMGQLAIIPTELTPQRINFSQVIQNRYFVTMLIVVVVGFVSAMYVSALASAVQISPISAIDWVIVLSLSIFVFGVATLTKLGKK
ncbi:MAG TPA: cation-transporting P-type ATPase [Nitrososphaerales archaeon]|nr:cation-transporting P-type ATPase [Nitrososphaerales archaeon]